MLTEFVCQVPSTIGCHFKQCLSSQKLHTTHVQASQSYWQNNIAIWTELIKCRLRFYIPCQISSIKHTVSVGFYCLTNWTVSSLTRNICALLKNPNISGKHCIFKSLLQRWSCSRHVSESVVVTAGIQAIPSGLSRYDETTREVATDTVLFAKLIKIVCKPKQHYFSC